MVKEFVKTLLADGHIVYGSARRLEKMRDIEKEGAKILSLDITDRLKWPPLTLPIIEWSGCSILAQIGDLTPVQLCDG